MKLSIRLTILAALLVTGLAGCDDCNTEPNVPDPSVNVGQSPIGESPTEKGTGALVDPSADESNTSPQTESNVQPTPPLEQALSAPDDAVTSKGRFSELMEQGLAEHAPSKGVVFASGGVDQLTTRIVVSADAQVRWAHGDGAYWDKLDQSGKSELGDKQRKNLADLLEPAWTERDLDYPPSAAGRGELLVLRDGDTARVIEGSKLPRELLALRQWLMDIPPPAQP